jgi:hypothetical protein
MENIVLNPTTHILFTNEQAFEIVAGEPKHRSLLEGDEVLVEKVEVVGWNTRVHFTVEKAIRDYVPPTCIHYWTQVGKSYYLDFLNTSANNPNTYKLNRLFREKV